MYARGVDATTWNYARPVPRVRQPLSASIGRRIVTWSAVVLFAVFALSKAVQGGTAPGYTSVTVGRGETLWSIAADRYPDADTREKVDQIMHANAMSQPLVYPGERIRVPNQ